MVRLAVGEVTGGGTAFAVTDRLALTARHAVGALRTTVRITMGSGTFSARVEAAAPDLDVALLRFSRPLPKDYRVLRLSDEVAALDLFRAPGYPYLQPLDRAVTQLTVTGRVTDLAVPVDGTDALQLTVQEAAAREPLSLHGLSGGPVLVGPDDLAVGIIRWSPEQDGLAVGGICLATPSSAALARWPAKLAGAFVRPRLARLVRTSLLPSGELPTPAELDLAELQAVVGPHHWRDGAAPYVRRTGDDELDTAFRGEGAVCVLITGEPRSGKTRSAIEAVSRNCGGDRVVVPTDWASLVELVDRDSRSPLATHRLTWFLDDLNGYLRSGRDPMAPVVARLLERPGGAMVVATIRSDHLALLPEAEGGLEPQRARELRLLEQSSGRSVTVERLADADELRRARQAYPLEVFTEAVGIAERLGRADEVRGRYRGELSPARQALMRAAVDWCRVGRSEPVPSDQLQDWFSAYVRTEQPFQDIEADAFPQALGWATSPLYPGASRLALLQPVSGPPTSAFLVETYLAAVDDGLTQDRSRPVPQLAWELGLHRATPEECLSVGLAALARAEWRRAERAVAHASGPGLLGSEWSVARWVVFGAHPAAIEPYLASQRASADLGHWEGFYNQAVHATTPESFTDLMEQAVGTNPGPEVSAFLLDLLGLASWYRDDLPGAVACWRRAAREGRGPRASSAAIRAALWSEGQDRRDLFATATAAGPAWAAAALSLGPAEGEEVTEGVTELLKSTDPLILALALDEVVMRVVRASPDAADTANLLEEVARYRLAAVAQTFGDMFKHNGDPSRAERWYRVAIATGQAARRGPTAHGSALPLSQVARAEAAAALNLANLCMSSGRAPLARWAYAHAIDTQALGSFTPDAIASAAEARSRMGVLATFRSVFSVPYPLCPFCLYEPQAHPHAFADVAVG